MAIIGVTSEKDTRDRRSREDCHIHGDHLLSRVGTELLQGVLSDAFPLPERARTCGSPLLLRTALLEPSFVQGLSLSCLDVRNVRNAHSPASTRPRRSSARTSPFMGLCRLWR